MIRSRTFNKIETFKQVSLYLEYNVYIEFIASCMMNENQAWKMAKNKQYRNGENSVEITRREKVIWIRKRPVTEISWKLLDD